MIGSIILFQEAVLLGECANILVAVILALDLHRFGGGVALLHDFRSFHTMIIMQRAGGK